MKLPSVLSAIVLVATCFVLPVFAQIEFVKTEFTGKTMGPIDYKVVIYDRLETPSTIKNGIQNRLEEINSLMSTYVESSDVSRVNRAAEETWVDVDPLTVFVVAKAQHFSELTDGAFDITVGPAVNFWKFGPDTDTTDTTVEELRDYVGYNNVEFRITPPAIKKTDARTKIDLSAIAKGFAVDRVAEWLRNENLTNFMVEVGGEVFASGKTPKGFWRIGIEQPIQSQRTIATVALLSDMAMATSGDYRNFRMENGKRISHTIDPKTCQPVINQVASISIVVDDCLSADAVATAIMAMGTEKGRKLCDSQGYEYVLFQRTESKPDVFSLHQSNSFPADFEVVNTRLEKKSIWPAFIGALVIFSLAIAGMAVGAIFNNKPITGSCGGIAATQNEDGSSNCTLCKKPVAECPDKPVEV